MSLKAEISSDSIATSCGVTVTTGSPLLALCRKLVSEGCDPASGLEAYRDGVLALTVRSIGEAATLEAQGGGGFRRVKALGSAPPISATMPSTLAA